MSKQVILFLAANPAGTSEIGLDKECRDIQKELRSTHYRDDFQFESRWAVGVDDVLRSLNELRPTVIHFSGHGHPREGIMLEGDDDLEGRPLAPAAFAELIAAAADKVRLVVLNACYTDQRAKVLCGPAECVVGMSGPVRDGDARRYAVALYRALGYRKSIAAAHRQGIASVRSKRSRASSKLARDVGPAPGDAPAFAPALLARAGVDPAKVLLAPSADVIALRWLRKLVAATMVTSSLIMISSLVLAWPIAIFRPAVPATPAGLTRAFTAVIGNAAATMPRPIPPERTLAPIAPKHPSPPPPPPKPRPSIAIVRPRDGAWVSPDFVIQVQASEVAAVSVRLGGRPSVEVAAPGPYVFRIPGGLDGQTVRIRATAQGRDGSSVERTTCMHVKLACWVRGDEIARPLIGRPECGASCIRSTSPAAPTRIPDDDFDHCHSVCICP